ncbi:hypothetical protein WJX72_010821 [[Myrmecia] bisecta]|uniref:Ribosome biogenesis protein BMS1 n=1 Tax=[Myrmecia] bisecta TaxID=41462 RepID=A0AAW1QTL3_9CHLO
MAAPAPTQAATPAATQGASPPDTPPATPAANVTETPTASETPEATPAATPPACPLPPSAPAGSAQAKSTLRTIDANFEAVLSLGAAPLGTDETPYMYGTTTDPTRGLAGPASAANLASGVVVHLDSAGPAPSGRHLLTTITINAGAAAAAQTTYPTPSYTIPSAFAAACAGSAACTPAKLAVLVKYYSDPSTLQAAYPSLTSGGNTPTQLISGALNLTISSTGADAMQLPSVSFAGSNVRVNIEPRAGSVVVPTTVLFLDGNSAGAQTFYQMITSSSFQAALFPSSYFGTVSVSGATLGTASNPNATPASKKKANAGAIAGGVIGGVAFLCIVAGIGYYVHRKRQGKAKKAQASKKRTRAAKEGGAAAGDGEQEAKQKRKRPKKSHSGSQRESSSSDIDAASGELSGSDDERDLERRIDAQTTLAKAAADADASAPVGVTVIPDDVEVDNAAMQKLLRAPRYFDVDFEDTAFKCFKCGGRGHMARDCPNQERQKPCFLCAQFGHTRQNCPNRISGVICFKCNRAGHLARDCPGGTQTGPQLQRLCQRCGFADCEAAAEGDLYRAEGGCSRSYSESDLQHVRCYVCGAKGHLCCQPSPATKLKQTCYNCGEGGHTADECYKDAMPGVEAERRGRPNDRNFNRLAAPGRSTPMDYDYPRSAGSGRSTPVDYSAYTNTREAWSSPAYAAQPAARSGAYASYAAQAVYGGGGSSYSQRVVAMQAHTAGGGVYSQQAYASGATYATPPQLQPQYGTPGSQSGGSGGGYRRGGYPQQQYGPKAAMGADKGKKKKKGGKAAKKKLSDKKKAGEDGAATKARNPKAFVFATKGRAKLARARTAEKEQKRMHVPVVERAPEEPPPFVILVHGPPQVGKTTLIKGLIKHYTSQNISEVKGPITVVSGKSRRLTFVECPEDLHGMIDAAKYADLVLLLIDGSFGFEMETFEFLNLLQVHGFPKVMGVLTHLDGFKDNKRLKKTKKALKHRFWTEIYQGAKLFYLSGMRNGKYMKREILNLARFISVMKFRPLSWRGAHPYLLTDRFEDITPVERIREHPKCDREVTVYGYLRGCNMKPAARVHLAGVGDYSVQDVDALPDPCPLPSSIKRRGLNEKERLLYAPMADVGGLLYDKDAVYIDIPDWKVQFSGKGAAGQTEGESMVRHLQGTQEGIDEKLSRSAIQLFQGGALLQGDQAGDSGAESESGGESGDEEEGESEGEEEDSDEEGAGPRLQAGLPEQAAVRANGRLRRRAVFGDDPVAAARPAAGSDSDEDDDDQNDGEGESGDEEGRMAGQGNRGGRAQAHDAEGDGGSSDDDLEGLGAAAKWKSNMLANATTLFSRRSADLQSCIYGITATAGRRSQNLQPEDDDRLLGGSDSDDDNDLFVARQTESAERPQADALDGLDTCRPVLDDEVIDRWGEEDARERLRNRFVTGDWDAAAQRADATPGENSDDEVYGEFEDLETGEKFGGDGDQATSAALQAIADEARQLRAEKAAKKAAFDAEYDVGGSKGVADDPAGKPKAQAKADDGSDDEEETYYDAMKREMGGRAARTKAAMDALDPAQRVAMEGYRPGTYLRMRFTGMPCELVQHFNPAQPLLVGGLAQAEEGSGFMQLRLKRHRWFPKTLKTRDPLIFSIGWRRFQSVPVYATEDANSRYRMLKYTPEHMHCLASIWGALAPPNTGVIAVQSAQAGQQGWRISATGVVLQLDPNIRIAKKLKLVGHPIKVHKHTAFISGMFNSQLEVSKFEGATLRTVSGIRGTIKKAVRPGVQGGRDGTFRASFEDKPLMSDIVFLRAWIAVDLPKLYNPVTNLLAGAVKQKRPDRPAVKDPDAEEVPSTAPTVPAPTDWAGDFAPADNFGGERAGYTFKLGDQGLGYYRDDGTSGAAAATGAAGAPGKPDTGAAAEPAGWVGMKTVAQLRRDLGIGAPRNSDSLYRPIERKPRAFNPLRIPKALQAELPFKSKPKLEPARKRKTLEQKRAVVLEPHERKAVSLVQQLNAIRNEKAVKRRASHARRKQVHTKKLEAEEAWRKQYNKEERKKRYLEKGMAEKRENYKKQKTADD